MDIATYEEGVASSLRTANRTTGCVTACGTEHGPTDLILTLIFGFCFCCF